MTENEVQNLKAILVGTSAYYGESLSDDVLTLFVADLEDLPFDLVMQSIKEIRRDPKQTRCPRPAIIRARIEPAPTDDDQVQIAISRILEAVARFGWPNHTQARQHLGDLSWAIIEREGGWVRVCENLSQDNLGTTRAQWRQLGLSLCAMSRAGLLDAKDELPTPKIEAKKQDDFSTQFQALFQSKKLT